MMFLTFLLAGLFNYTHIYACVCVCVCVRTHVRYTIIYDDGVALSQPLSPQPSPDRSDPIRTNACGEKYAEPCVGEIVIHSYDRVLFYFIIVVQQSTSIRSRQSINYTIYYGIII